MIILIASFASLVLLYLTDFKLAFKVARRDLALFERVEANKALVFAIMKDIIEKSNRNIILFHATNLSSWVLGSILFGSLGLMFNIPFVTSVTLFLLTQAGVHLIGILSDLYALHSLKKAPQATQKAGAGNPPSYT